jgi:hypothetical protein
MLRLGLTTLEPENIHYMLDQCKASGWTRIYWRLFDGGRTNYSSNLADRVSWDDDNYHNPQNPADLPHTFWWGNAEAERQRGKVLEYFSKVEYSELDTLAEAVRYGHEIGLEIHSWITINEDDHGWGLTSRFTRNNPQSRWRKRDGTFYHSQQSFAFPEVQKYKLAIIEEVLDNYETDGIFLDWMRTGDVRDDPQNDENGVANFGYEEPLVHSFHEKYGIDPYTIPNEDERWVAWRAQPQTEFMRDVRKLMKKVKPELPLAVMGQHSWSYRSGHNLDGNLRGLLLDTATWASEGLMDAVVAAGYYRDGGNAKQAYHWLCDETQNKLDVWLFGWVPNTAEEFDKYLALAEELNAPQILFWEGDYIDARENKVELQEHMRESAASAKSTFAG